MDVTEIDLQSNDYVYYLCDDCVTSTPKGLVSESRPIPLTEDIDHCDGCGKELRDAEAEGS